MKNNDTYKFVGVINRFGIYPDFVYPIFERDGKYYFQSSEDNIISSFKEIKENLYVNMIRFFDDSMLANIQVEHLIGGEQVIAFQLDRDNFFVSGIAAFASFIKNFVTDDNILSEQIDIFFDNMNKKNYQIKKKEKIK